MKQVTFDFDENKAKRRTGFYFDDKYTTGDFLSIVQWLSWSIHGDMQNGRVNEDTIRRASELEDLLASLSADK